MKLIYGIEDKPKFSKTLVFAFQQMIAIMAATLLVPLLVTSYGLQADAAAALFGAGIGTIVYLFCTKRRSPVFLGSSFTFLGAYAATIGQNYGYWGMLIGVAFAGLVYVIIGLVIKVVGSGWVNKLMPSVIIGPIVALIGLSLSGTATSWIMGNGAAAVVYGETYNWAAIICGIFTFFMIVIASVKGSKTVKLIPFIVHRRECAVIRLYNHRHGNGHRESQAPFLPAVHRCIRHIQHHQHRRLSEVLLPQSNRDERPVSA